MDIHDAFPMDPTEWADNDLDGIGDNADPMMIMMGIQTILNHFIH